MGHTVIQIPVPALEPVVRPLLIAVNPDLAVTDDPTVCAHITLLGPFVDRHEVDANLLNELRDLLAQVSPFSFELARPERFPGGLVYLAPEPAEPFLRLTEMLSGAFPAWPPYGGAFDEVIPHLSIGDRLTPEQLRMVASHLPVATSAEEAHLTWWSETSVSTLALIPLGESGRPSAPDGRGDRTSSDSA